MEASNTIVKNESVELDRSFGLEEFRDIEIKHRQSVVDSLVGRNKTVSFDTKIRFGVDLVQAMLNKHSREPFYWATSTEKVEAEVANFVRFFDLMVENPTDKLVPTVAIDDVWHEFMLHPVEYFQTCMRESGVIIDHNGGFGSTPNEEAEWGHSLERTAQLWSAKFHSTYPALIESNIASCRSGEPPAGCSRSCRGGAPR